MIWCLLGLFGFPREWACKHCGESTNGHASEAYDGLGCDGCMWQYDNKWVPKGKTHESEGIE